MPLIGHPGVGCHIYILREFVKLPSSWPPARVEGGVWGAVLDTTSVVPAVAAANAKNADLAAIYMTSALTRFPKRSQNRPGTQWGSTAPDGLQLGPSGAQLGPNIWLYGYIAIKNGTPAQCFFCYTQCCLTWLC